MDVKNVKAYHLSFFPSLLFSSLLFSSLLFSSSSFMCMLPLAFWFHAAYSGVNSFSVRLRLPMLSFIFLAFFWRAHTQNMHIFCFCMHFVSYVFIFLKANPHHFCCFCCCFFAVVLKQLNCSFFC